MNTGNPQPEVPLDLHAFPSHLAERLRREQVPEVSFSKDQLIFSEGDPGHEAYFVLEGSVAIQKKDERGDARILDVLETGAMFGEMALLDHPRRSATARAETDCRLFVIPREHVQQLIHNVPQMAVWLLESFSRRLRRADDRLTQMEKVQEVATRVISAQQAERTQIAREILEGPAQDFTDYVMKVDICQHLLDQDPEKLRGALSELKTALEHGLAHLQGLVATITPETVAHDGLDALLADHIAKIQTESGLEIKLGCPVIRPDDVDYHVQSTVFCLVQAALTHVCAYGQAHRVEVHIGITDDRLTLMIADDGPGFDVAKVRAGYYKEEMENFEAMRDRAKLVGGHMRLKSQPGKGTLMDFQIPRSTQAPNPGS